MEYNLLYWLFNYIYNVADVGVHKNTEIKHLESLYLIDKSFIYDTYKLGRVGGIIHHP